MTLPPGRYLDHLEGAAARFSAVLADADLTAPVPACPGWDVTDLTGHLGGIHRWARDAVVEGRPTDDERPHPRDRDGLRSWFAEGAAELVATLRATDPATPCWNFGPKPRTADFWFRRQAHEIAMHARDLEEAAHGTAEPLDPELVLDGIGEILEMFLPRQVRLGRLDPPAQVVELRTTNSGTGAFRLAPAGGRRTRRHGHRAGRDPAAPAVAAAARRCRRRPGRRGRRRRRRPPRPPPHPVTGVSSVRIRSAPTASSSVGSRGPASRPTSSR